MLNKNWLLVKENEKLDLIYKVGGTKAINFENITS